MKLFLKRTVFLLLMALLGGLSLFLHSSGYPFAWRFSSNQGYWLPLMYSVNLLCVIAVVAMVFWSLRGFLFDRGRPWLAWFSISTWALVWAAAVLIDVGGKAPLWTFSRTVSNEALGDRVQTLQQQAWSVDEIKGFPDDQRKQICSNAILEDETRIVIKREGFPMEMALPKDVAGKGLFDADACPTELVTQFQKLKALRTKAGAVVAQEDYGVEKLKALNTMMSAAAQLTLLAHPDALVRIAEIYKTYKDAPIEKTIAVEELTLQIYTNGQVKEHQWVEMLGQTSEAVNKVSIDPRIWLDSDKDGADSWKFWTRLDSKDGSFEQNLYTGDCIKKTMEMNLQIAKNAQGVTKLSGILGEAEVVEAGTYAEVWLQKVCASKDQQARIPDELKDKKLGE